MKRLFPPLVVAAFFATACLVRAAAWSYTASDILPFQPLGLTDAGKVTGAYAGHPAIWQDGQMTTLPLLPGTVYGWVRSGNSLGHLVGACRSLEANGTYASHACVWTNGVVRALAEVPGTDESSAWAINDAGTIAGNVYSGTNGSFREAVVWNGNSVAKLQAPVAGSQTWARAINSSGQIAVFWAGPGAYYSSLDDSWVGNQAARWTPDVPKGTSGTVTTFSSARPMMTRARPTLAPSICSTPMERCSPLSRIQAQRTFFLRCGPIRQCGCRTGKRLCVDRLAE